MKKVLLEISCSCLAAVLVSAPLALADENLRWGYGGQPSYEQWDECYYDYSTHYDGASYPYILDSIYNDDYQRPPYVPGKHYPEFDCYDKRW